MLGRSPCAGGEWAWTRGDGLRRGRWGFSDEGSVRLKLTQEVSRKGRERKVVPSGDVPRRFVSCSPEEP
jgi:hypothetical protein